MTLREVLTERSWRHLVEFVDFTLQPLLEGASSDAERDRATELHLITFREFESLLKLAVDRRDAETLAAIDDAWTDTPDDPWWLWEEQAAYEEDPAQTRIGRDRLVARMGVAMWTAHELAHEQDPVQRERLVSMLRNLGSHFGTLDHLFLALEWALEQEDGRQWDTWFLGQLSERRAHFIPTRQQLLGVTLLVALDRVTDGAAVKPRAWMRDSWNEIDATLKRIESEPELWRPVLGLEATVSGEAAPSETPRAPALEDRVRTLRETLEVGRDGAEEARRDEIRRAAPDPSKRSDLRGRILSGFAETRVVHYIVHWAGAATRLDAMPQDHERQVLRTWLSKELLVPEGRMVGIDFVARDLVRASARAEFNQLLMAMPDQAPEPVDGALGSYVRRRISDLREDRIEPSLIVMPISWDARRALDLQAVGDEWSRHLTAEAARALEGVVDGVPVLDSPLVEDRLWIIDVRQAVVWEEWPSDDDSGLAFDIRFFDEAAAGQLLAEHPEIREEGKTDAQVIQDLRTKALLTLAMCFRAGSGNPGAAVGVELPEELRRPRRPAAAE